MITPGRDTKFTVPSFLCLYVWLRNFLSRGLTDRHEILHGGSAASRTGLLPFWGISPGMVEFWASTGAYVQICFLLKHLLILKPYLKHFGKHQTTYIDKFYNIKCIT